MYQDIEYCYIGLLLFMIKYLSIIFKFEIIKVSNNLLMLEIRRYRYFLDYFKQNRTLN